MYSRQTRARPGPVSRTAAAQPASRFATQRRRVSA